MATLAEADTRTDAKPPGSVRPLSPRLLSLDVFRGITIAGMLLVNNPGTWEHVYAPLQHAAWNGSTPTDLIFPFFLFIVGVAATLSLGSSLDRGLGRGAVLRRAVVRAAVIFTLGLLLQGFPHYHLGHLRTLGVLQRIALSYVVGAVIMLWTGVRGQLTALVGVLVGYWLLLIAVPVPGIGPGVLEPNMNLSNWLDYHVLGPNHLPLDPGTWDPEGILSTLGAIGTVLCGILAGDWMRTPRRRSSTALGLAGAGGLAVALGLIWGVSFPINKSLWTGSFVLFSAGVACLVLAGLFWLIDDRGRREWTAPFLVFGTNALTAYWLSSVVAIIFNWVVVTGGAGEPVVLRTYLYERLFAPWLSPSGASLAYGLAYVLLWLGLLTPLYRRRIFIRI
jgi:predicted acyltransferase